MRFQWSGPKESICLGVVLGSAFLLLAGCGGSSNSSANGATDGGPDTDTINTGNGEICDNGIDDDQDGAKDCADLECKEEAACTSSSELCDDGLDNDWDGKIDCSDSDCSVMVYCSEVCDNDKDDNGNELIDCADPICKGIHPACGEVCGDGIDNDGDNKFDCDDEDCAGVDPPCGNGDPAGGMICAYKDSEPHPCLCDDGIDNDNDGFTDLDDLQCYGPYDDNEEEWATGIPGDNEGSNADKECPFDGNSGTGNDDLCCNPADPTTNVTPNGCDDKSCCEIDVNGNSTGEHVKVMGDCVYAPACGTEGTHNCICTGPGDCDDGQFCVMDDDVGPGFCSKCEPCVSNEPCSNPCDCGETCFGGFEQPESECGGDDGGDPDGGIIEYNCPDDLTACPGGDANCNVGLNETCVNGCCYAQCPQGVTPCESSADCVQEGFICITGCCIEWTGPI